MIAFGNKSRAGAAGRGRCRCAAAFVASLLAAAAASAQPAGRSVVDTAVDVLDTAMSQGDRIPPRLLAEAHGVAVIPNVVKGGLVVGVRRGHGVMLVRGQDGNWQLPTFVTLTGGSLGWQAGIQSTDLVLVFKNRRSIENLMTGKLTLGVDASAAAGPVGRKAQAATDGRLAAEIYSYSRSRGLFAGVSVDGATLKVDHAAQQAYYRLAGGQTPAAAGQLVSRLSQYSRGRVAGDAARPGAPDAAALLRQLQAAEQRLLPLLDDTWRQYLRLPLPGPLAPGQTPLEALQLALQRFDQVAGEPRYASLHRRGEFAAARDLLRRYLAAIAPRQAQLQLPPPPGAARR